MEADGPIVRFEDGFRRTLETPLSLEPFLDSGVLGEEALPVADAPLSPPDLLLCLAPLLRRWLPVGTVDYHALHVEFLGRAVHREKVGFDIRVEKQALGKGWKVVVRCRKASGEYAAVVELLASVAQAPSHGPA